MSLEDVNPHYALLKSELAETAEEVAFKHFVTNIEFELGHDLDGDQDTDGYSIDLAYDMFASGSEVEDAVEEFKVLKENAKPAFLETHISDF